MNRDNLKSLMIAHSLDRYAVADYLGVRKTTVDSWLASPDATNFRNMPDQMLELLTLKLK